MLPWQAEQQIFTPTRIAVRTSPSPAPSLPPLYSPNCLFLSAPLLSSSFILLSVRVSRLSLLPALSFPKELWCGCQCESQWRGRGVACTEAPFSLLLHSLSSWVTAGFSKSQIPLWGLLLQSHTEADPSICWLHIWIPRACWAHTHLLVH